MSRSDRAGQEILRHCEPTGLAFGEPKDKLREAISVARQEVASVVCGGLAMTRLCRVTYCAAQRAAATEACAIGIRPGSGLSARSTISPVGLGDSMISRSAAVTSLS